MINSLRKTKKRMLELLDNYTIVNITDDFESSELDLGDCEAKLREYYNISLDIELTLIKLEMKTINSLINHIQYEIYNPYNKSEKLDLSICQEEKVKIINHINPSLSRMRLINIIESSSDYENIFSDDSKFYTDYCSKFTSEEGADVLIQDRHIDFNYEGQLCQPGCEINEINITYGLVTCLCPAQNSLGNISIFNFEQIYKEAKGNIKQHNNDEKNKNLRYSNNNFKAFSCIKNIFNSGYKNNYVLIILTFLIFIYLIMIGIFFIYRKNKSGTIESNPPHPKDKKDKNNKTNNKEKNKEKNKGKKKDKSKEKYKGKKVDKDKVKSNLEKEEKRTTSPLKRSEAFNILSSKEKIKKASDNNDDINDSEYYKYLRDKKKSFYDLFISRLIERQLILSCLKNKNSLRILNLLLLDSLIINHIGINTFFFSEKNIHQIYIDKNIYNFCYQAKFIIFSMIISHILLSLLKYLYSPKNRFNQKIKYILFFTLSFIIFLFFWIYVGAITSVYINAKRHLFINIIICLLFEIVLEVLLTLIITTFRYLGLKFNCEIIYVISKIINYF